VEIIIYKGCLHDAQKLPSALQTWLDSKNFKSFPFQQECREAYLNGESGILNAPTGSGKTLALWLPCLEEYMWENPDWDKPSNKKNGLQILWITPLRALTKDLARAMQEVCDEIQLPWQVAMRTGDTSTSERTKQRKNMPECLLTTPESLHMLLASKKYDSIFKNLQTVVVDEWHELLGTKRGVQVELGLSRLRAIRKDLKVWGISATIGNLEQAGEVLIPTKKISFIKAKIQKKINVQSIIPDEVEKFPWAGNMGTKLIDKVLPIIEQSKTTLIFTNTRARTEIWYQHLLNHEPNLAGAMAMHHGSLSREVRDWVENALHEGILKVVVCTSSLDLGVDFRPVETVIQVGSPKGVARFLQRAGRSGHRPDATSNAYFLPAHGLELLEGAAMKQATHEITQLGDISHMESREPIQRAFDVLVQYLVTLAVSDGFRPVEIYREIKATYCYRNITEAEWNWCLSYIVDGGEGLEAYDEYNKVEIDETGLYQVNSRKVAMRHRLSMGTITSEPIIKLKFKTGKYVGSVEEYFVSRLKQGDVFYFAGQSLEFVQLKGMVATVQKSKKKSTKIPRWTGGRMPLSSQLSELIREKLEDYETSDEPEIRAIQPILEMQRKWSCIPTKNQLLIESTQTKEGFHIFVYPFQGRLVHEIMAMIIAYRIAQLEPISFSFAMNDYGFELFSDVEIPIEHALSLDLFSVENIDSDIEQSLNQTEMAKRKFRSIAQVAGLLFQGFPGKPKRMSHLHASSQLLFSVFEEYDPENLLIRQAFEEVLSEQLEKPRLLETFRQIQKQEIVLKKTPRPTPFAFPILVDRMREQISSETIESKIAKMVVEFESL
jgi:ATP-dependent Lhr-like helicase